MTGEKPNIPRAKRAGLQLDLDDICARGPAALEADDHYRLKTYGVCAQRQDDLFMVRLRVTAGELAANQVAALAAASRAYAGGWVHVTTRQNIELHSVRLGDVPALYRVLTPVGLVGRSACGHTVRNVTCCAGAATSADEPFDATPDARFLSHFLVARSDELNVSMSGRLNIHLGGCAECGLEALTSDIGLVSVVQDGVAGYQLWVGGSTGTAPRIAILLRAFLPRERVLAAVWAVVEFYMEHSNIDDVAKGRLKFVIERVGEPKLRTTFHRRFLELCGDATLPTPAPVELATEATIASSLARAPSLGWRDGIAPQRTPGLATITVRLPLGDLLADELEAVAALSPDVPLVLTRDQNLLVRNVPVGSVATVVGGLAAVGLGPSGTRGALDVRACPGLAFCSLAITGSQPLAVAVEQALAVRFDLPRDVNIAVSGCPNSCTKHQTADIGLAGTKVKVDGRVAVGYQLFLGADLQAGLFGEAVVRLLEDEVPHAVVSVLDTWVAIRRPGETPGQAFRRVGLAAIASAVEERLRVHGWTSRPEPAEPIGIAS